MRRYMQTMKKTVIAIILSVSLVLGGFGTALPSVFEGAKVQTVKAADASCKVSIKTYKKNYKTKKGLVYKRLEFQYPVLTIKDQTVQKNINAFYQKQLKSWKKQAVKDLKEAKKLAKKDRCYGDGVSCEISYRDDKYISILQNGSAYNMGAHGNPYRYTNTFHLKTGKKVDLKQALGVNSTKEVNQKVSAAFLKLYKKNKNGFFASNENDFKKEVKKMKFDKQWYFDKKGNVVVYASVYELAPYAAGYISVTL